MSNTTFAAADLSRCLRNAKRRALYWSGIPSFIQGASFAPGTHGRRDSPDLEYELALADVDALQSKLTEIDGVCREQFDPRADFRRRWSEGMAKAAQRQP